MKGKGKVRITELVLVALVILFVLVKVFEGISPSLLMKYIRYGKNINPATLRLYPGLILQNGEGNELDKGSEYASYMSMYEYVSLENVQDVDKQVEEPSTEEVEDSIVAGARNIIGPVYSQQELNNLDFLKKNFYTITSITSLNQENFQIDKALELDLSIEKSAEPQILIFHSHSQESFRDSSEGDYSTYITGVGAKLAEILRNEYGYNVIHDTTTFDILDGKLDRSKAYTYANEAVKKYLEKYPSIKVVLDVHRDGVDESVHLVTEMDGKPTARIMYFNGISYTNKNGAIDYLYNPYLQENLSMSLQMKLLSEAYYPGFTRNIYIQGYRYSQHHAARSMLIEVGAQNNTLEEAMNAMIPLADILNKLLTGEKVYH